MSELLSFRGVEAGYGEARVLHGIDLAVGENERVAILGRNGVGKSTVVNTFLGVARLRAGEIRFRGAAPRAIRHFTAARAGVAVVLQGRQIIPNLSVRENLLLGAAVRRPGAWNLERVFELFPVLRSRMHQVAGTLSGGEQQMLTIGRALMAEPTMLMIDEPSLGLAPLFVKTMFEVVQSIRAQGLTVLLVEQNVRKALAMSDRAYVLENGRIVLEGTGPDLLEDPHLRQAYLGL